MCRQERAESNDDDDDEPPKNRLESFPKGKKRILREGQEEPTVAE